MTYEETISYLKSYKELYYRNEDIRNRMTGMKSPTFSDMPSSGHGPDNLVLLSEIEKNEIKMNSIMRMIGVVPEYRARIILKYKYQYPFYTLEEISEKMKWSLSTIKNDHRKAIQFIQRSQIK